MINAKELKETKTKKFKESFNFEVFDAYITEKLKKNNYIEIGVDYNYRFKDSPFWNLNFGYAKNYIWETSIQVHIDIWREVFDYLKECGLNVSWKKACGYEDPDVIVAKL